MKTWIAFVAEAQPFGEGNPGAVSEQIACEADVGAQVRYAALFVRGLEHFTLPDQADDLVGERKVVIGEARPLASVWTRTLFGSASRTSRPMRRNALSAASVRSARAVTSTAWRRG